ncbi:uncharacterized protein PAC_11465 [Phialocephala subalpina]|uniref:Peptidase S33 tripeptidyl aminopeptidase-like C-terminal domain-containing protein n=1 Tax=Phialocephala subalpina TaxID=576137 RepID=A0A1L7X954_9HELO|nr:uncharacterized protein PAC_11465 [Phialocephala subalpina]
MTLLLFFSKLLFADESTNADDLATNPTDTFSQITPSINLTWCPCLGKFECAVLDVPLDYSNTTGARSFVTLLKIPATTTPYKGMVLTNPGGPGESAIDDLLNNGAYEASIFGSNCDFVAWEPRGIGYSIPATNCSSSLTPIPGIQERSAGRSSNHSADLTGPFLRSIFFNDGYEGATCQTLTGGTNDAGPHMSTIYLVQDMLTIVDAYASNPQSQGVKNALLVNFWGFSYGTFVAQTFAPMYPDRVGRFVIDRVVDPDDYRSGNLLKNLEFTLFIAISRVRNAYDIFERFENRAERLDVMKAEERGWENATAISLALEGLKQFAHIVAYEPISGFPALAPVLLFMESASMNISKDRAIEWTRAVACSDMGNVLYNFTLQELANVARRMEEQNYVGGGFWASLRVACAGWGIEGKGRYTGAFGGVTQNPMLFVSNTIDPGTPYYK